MKDEKEFRKDILEYLYNKGWRYIGRDHVDAFRRLCVYSEKPWKDSLYWDCAGKILRVEVLDGLFPDITWGDEEPFDIAKAIGIIDWFKVPVNTRVYVSDKSITDIESKGVYKRHFAYYKNGSESPFQVFENGATSFTVRREGNKPATSGWKYCKLAEGAEYECD